jgi:hypothetical protein
MKFRRLCPGLICCAAAFTLIVPAPAQSIYLGPGTDPQVLREVTTLARQKVRAEKVQIISQNIFLKDDEAARFWPVFNDYNAALEKLLDERVAILQLYAETYHKMDDESATAMAERVFNLEEKRTQLKRAWFKKFAQVVPPKKAAQFFQLENQINAALDLQLLGSLPRIQ